MRNYKTWGHEILTDRDGSANFQNRPKKSLQLLDQWWLQTGKHSKATIMNKLFSNPWIIGIGTTMIAGIILYFLLEYPSIILNQPEQKIALNQSEQKISTSAINALDLFSKARKFETGVEQQDFLNKYINTPIYGTGVVEDIDRISGIGGGDGFLVSIKINNQTVTCFQEGDEENERRLLLLKGKNVGFTGIFNRKQTSLFLMGFDSCLLK